MGVSVTSIQEPTPLIHHHPVIYIYMGGCASIHHHPLLFPLSKDDLWAESVCMCCEGLDACVYMHNELSYMCIV